VDGAAVGIHIRSQSLFLYSRDFNFPMAAVELRWCERERRRCHVDPRLIREKEGNAAERRGRTSARHLAFSVKPQAVDPTRLPVGATLCSVSWSTSGFPLIAAHELRHEKTDCGGRCRRPHPKV